MERLERADRRRVFVVHGRNSAARKALYEFLRAVDLSPLEWGHAVEESRHGAPFVGEVLDQALSTVSAVVVLLTGDDFAMLAPQYHEPGDPPTETALTPQARPNVLFEAGLALGRLPRSTILVQLGTIRPFSDIAGRHIIHLNNTVASRQEFANRLRTAGCPADLRGTDWHAAGNFDLPQTNPPAVGSEAPVEPEDPEELTTHELAILRFLELQEDADGSTHFSAEQIAEELSLPLSRAKHYLADLKQKRLIWTSYYVSGDPDHSLTREGRAYLVQLGDRS